MDRRSFQRIVIKEAFLNRQMYEQLLSKVTTLHSVPSDICHCMHYLTKYRVIFCTVYTMDRI